MPKKRRKCEKTLPPFFREFSGGRTNGKQGKCSHTCYFCVPAGCKKRLLGSLPKPGDFGTSCPEVVARCALCPRPDANAPGLNFVPKRKPGYGTSRPPVRQMWKAFCKKYENKEIGLPTPKVQL